MEAGSLGPAMELATRHAFQVMCGHACNNHASARTVAALRLPPIPADDRYRSQNQKGRHLSGRPPYRGRNAFGSRRCWSHVRPTSQLTSATVWRTVSFEERENTAFGVGCRGMLVADPNEPEHRRQR